LRIGIRCAKLHPRIPDPIGEPVADERGRMIRTACIAEGHERNVEREP
jgi:hypothetical protein